MAEWLRRWTANPMGSARVGSNPILVVMFSSPHNFVKRSEYSSLCKEGSNCSSFELFLFVFLIVSFSYYCSGELNYVKCMFDRIPYLKKVKKRFPLPGIEPGPAG